MRWKHHNPEVGDKRARKKFLFLPKTIAGEVRWLEHVEFEEEYIAMSIVSKRGFTRKEKWIAIRWIN